MLRVSDRAVVKQLVDEIAEENGGAVTGELMVERARDPRSPAHHLFNWDDASAAHQQRVSVARSLIRELYYEKHTPERRTLTVPYLVHEPRSLQQSYVHLEAIAQDSERSALLLMEEFKRCEGTLRRAVGIAEALGMREDFDDLLENFSRQIRIVAAKAQRRARRRRRGAEEGDDAR